MADPQEVAIPTLDGYTLRGRLFSPTGGASAAAVVAGAMAVPTRFYGRYANWLADNGVATVTFDYRGMRDAPLSASRARMRDWGERDIPAVLQWTADTLQPPRLYYVGHSAGGQMLGLAPNNTLVTAALFVSSQSGYWPLYRFPERYWMWFLWHVLFPGLVRVFGYFPSRWFRFGDDLPPQVALEWARWCRTPGYLYGDETLTSRHHIEQFERPILAYFFQDDSWATAKTRADVLSRYVRARITERYLHPREVQSRAVGHLGFFREACRDTLWRDSLSFLQEQPSG